MKKYVKFLSMIALLLAVTLSVKPAMAYFTTYTQANGTLKVSLGEETEIEEDFSDWTKKIVVTNKDSSNEDCFVRAIAYAPQGFELTYPVSDGWTQSGDYWYYNLPVAPGASTSELQVKIGNIPTSVINGDSFNVIVAYESIPVQYDAEGKPVNPVNADWEIGNN